jgi:thioredoxin-related protein
MLSTMKDLAAQGFYITIRQIDDDKKIRAQIPFEIKKASPKELKEKNITSWPVLLVADVKSQKLYRINGYQNASSIIQTIRNKK